MQGALGGGATAMAADVASEAPEASIAVAQAHVAGHGSEAADTCSLDTQPGSSTHNEHGDAVRGVFDLAPFMDRVGAMARPCLVLRLAVLCRRAHHSPLQTYLGAARRRLNILAGQAARRAHHRLPNHQDWWQGNWPIMPELPIMPQLEVARRQHNAAVLRQLLSSELRAVALAEWDALPVTPAESAVAALTLDAEVEVEANLVAVD